MKMFKKNKQWQKSWALDFEEIGNKVRVNAVDSENGKRIAVLIVFKENGIVRISPKAEEQLESDGYDPYEHGNEWNESGGIEIEIGK